MNFPKVTAPPTITPFAEMAWLPIPILQNQTAFTLLALLLVPGHRLFFEPHTGWCGRAHGGREPAGRRGPRGVGRGHANSSHRGRFCAGALLFAFFDALQLRLQQSGDAALPYQPYLMLPYVLSIVALIRVARKASYPQALIEPYRKGER